MQQASDSADCFRVFSLPQERKFFIIYIYKSQMQNLAHRITPEPRNRFGRQMSHWNRLTVLSVFLPNYGQITP